MKVFASCALLFSLSAVAAPYSYVYAKYSYSTLGGVTTLNVQLHNNGPKNASCRVTVFNREETTSVPAYGNSSVSFQSLPEGAQPRYSCAAD